MALRKRFTIVLIPHNQADVREFGPFAVMLSVLIIMLVGYGTFSVALPQALSLLNLGQVDSLRRQSHSLSARIEAMTHMVTELRGQMDQLVKTGEKTRLAIGLPDIDPDVRKVGVGGPTPAGEGRLRGELGSPLRVASGIQADLDQLLREARLESASLKSISSKAQTDQKYWRHIPTVRPVAGTTTSTFGMRSDPFTNLRRMHAGFDISARQGEKVRSTADGIVTNTGMDVNYGRFIEIDHQNGYLTRYGHLMKIITAKGAQIKRGDLIGLVGNTGRASGYHLHYEVHRNGRIVNPSAYFFPENEIVD